MKEEIQNFNGIILSNYQKIYPNLVEFSYDAASDSLMYEGNFAKLNGYGLSRVDPIFFQMNPDDIFLFFQNGFYQNSKESIQVNELFGQFIITEEEVLFLKKYAKKYIDRCTIYSNNKELLDKNCLSNENVKVFAEELLDGKNILEHAKKAAKLDDTNAASILINSYQDNNVTAPQKEATLTRKKEGFVPFNEEEYLREIERRNKLGVSGFTSIILIIVSAITFGMYIASILIG